MDKRKKVTLAIQSMSLAVSIVASQRAAQFVVEKKLAPTIAWFPSVVALLIAGCGLYLIRFFLDFAFDNMTGLRHLLLGDQFIEGQWYIIFRVEGKPVAFGETRIISTEEGVRFQGEDFQYGEEEGRGHYSTDIAILDWPTIKYKYHYYQSAAEEYSSQGYGEAQFFEGDHGAQKFSGIFLELLGKRVTYFEGWRVPQLDLENIKKSDGPDNKRERAKSFFKSMFPKMFPDTGL
jgi:hypothetical protein